MCWRSACLPVAAAMVLVLQCLPSLGASGDYVWWEGESPTQTNFPERTPFSAETFEATRHLLSGGDWLSNGGERSGDEAYAVYQVDVPGEGEYELWARKFWKHGPFRWRFDGDEWRVCGADVALADDTYLRTHLGANWVFLGDVTLTRGPHRFELRLLAERGESVVAAFDCFVLTREAFVPNGQRRPGERSGLADAGFFAFEPATDRFTDDALLDLRWLNEPTAGQSGFVRSEGNDFVLGSGEKVRFWGVNTGPNNIMQPHSSLDYLARALAKRGVNLVRIHGPIYDRHGDPERVDAERLDALFYAVAAFKRQGIYTDLSFYFPLWFEIKPDYSIPGYETIDNKLPFALLYFDERMQRIYMSWLRALLTTESPYTGRPLSREPAVAIIELVNEDSFFFWTFSKANIPAVHWRRLEERYGHWLAERYGSVEAALTAWEGERLPEDDPATSHAGVYEIWHLTRDGIAAGGPGKVKRVGDQVRFLTELQRGFYAKTRSYVRDELGSGSLVAASNWAVADPGMLDALERYTYTACDVLDRHGYFGGRHEGEGASYSVRVGHTFESLAAVTSPRDVPLQFVDVDGHPQIISEIGWPNPNRYRADATFLGSAYGALQGADGIFFFAIDSNWLNPGSMGKFGIGSPVMAYTFPAAALQYRRGDVREVGPVVHQALQVDDLYAMKGSDAWPAPALDQLRQQDIPDGMPQAVAAGPLDPLTFYVGRVARTYDADAGESNAVNLAPYIDRGAEAVRSSTEELSWHYGDGIALVDTPRSQGAAGFLAQAGKIDLADVSIECGNEFASVTAVSLDGQPLVTSRRILIQAMTEERPYGFATDDGRITSLGGRPFGVKELDIRVQLRLDDTLQTRVVALDENGYATGQPVRIRASATALEIELAPDSIYHIVTREPVEGG
jgi:hypothetical protein